MFISPKGGFDVYSYQSTNRNYWQRQKRTRPYE
jgi:hypothetical protein